MSNLTTEIKEETLTVTIKQFIALDGKIFVAEGPSEYQSAQAKNKCNYHNLQYDFMYFKVDETKLNKYNKKNWLHFKWYFLRNFIVETKWYNGVEEYRLEQYSWMNGLEKDKFEELIYQSIIDSRKLGTAISYKSWKNDNFIKIVINSGLLNKKFISIMNKEKLNSLYIRLMRYDKYWAIKECVNKSYFKITANAISELLGRLMGDKNNEENKSMGTHATYIECRWKDSKHILQYFITDENKDFLKYLYSVCIDDKIEILDNILHHSVFSTTAYAGTVIYYEYFHKLETKDAELRAEQTCLSYLSMKSNIYYKIKNQILDEDIVKVILQNKINCDYDTQVNEHTKKVYDILLPHFNGKEAELETYLYWASNGKCNWSKLHEILKKMDIKYVWNYTYSELLVMVADVLQKIQDNKDKLEEIAKARQKLNELEATLINK